MSITQRRYDGCNPFTDTSTDCDGYNLFTGKRTWLGWLQFIHLYKYGVGLVTIYAQVRVRSCNGYNPFTDTSTGWLQSIHRYKYGLGWLQSIHLYKHGVRLVTIYSPVKGRG